jgi:anti-anti-sigma factor
MDIKTIDQDGVMVLQLSCNLDGNTAPEAQEKIMPMLVSKCGLVMDLGKCNYISSAGLRVLLMVAKQVATQSGKLALCGVSDEIKDIMDMTGFSNFFETFDTVPAAVEAVRKEA